MKPCVSQTEEGGKQLRSHRAGDEVSTLPKGKEQNPVAAWRWAMKRKPTAAWELLGRTRDRLEGEKKRSW